MNFRGLRYGIVQGFISVFKNHLMSFASIGAIAICLFILNLSYIVVANIDYILESVDDNLVITTLFKNGISEDEIYRIKEQIQQRSEVAEIQYISSDEAFERFKKVFNKDKELLDIFQDENPLEDSASLEIFIKEASQQEKFVNYLQTIPNIRKVNYSKNSADFLINISNLIRYISIVIIIILVFVAVILMSNTIKLAVYIRKNEINIMKYIGATDIFIQFPFIIEGIIIGAVGAVLPIGIIFFCYDSIIEAIYNSGEMLKNLIDFIPIENIMSFIVPTSFIIGIGIGIIGSAISVKRHLRV